MVLLQSSSAIQAGLLSVLVVLLCSLSHVTYANEISKDGGPYVVESTPKPAPEYCAMNLTPPTIEWFGLHDIEWVHVNLTCNNEVQNIMHGKVFVILVTTQNHVIAQPKPTLPIKKCDPIFYRCDQIAVHVGNHTASRYFRIVTENIGRANLTVELVLMDARKANGVKTDSAKLITLPSQTVVAETYSIQCIRRRRLVDVVFDATIAGLAFVNAFAVGLLCDNEDLRKHYKKPLAAIAALVCQLLLMPAVGQVHVSSIQKTKILIVHSTNGFMKALNYMRNGSVHITARTFSSNH